MGHFVERELICYDEIGGRSFYCATGEKPYPYYLIDDIKGGYYYSIGSSADAETGEIFEVYYEWKEFPDHPYRVCLHDLNE
jgi:hypothetical protein